MERSSGNSRVISRHPMACICTSATVLAIVTWDKEKSEPQFQGNFRCENWEVVVPELVFEPERQSAN